MTTARWLFVAALLAPVPAAALEQPCLARSEVKGGYPRFHIVDGRQCWYAAMAPAGKPGAASPSAVQPDAAEPTAAADDIDVNPYGDPIWRRAETTTPRKPRRAKPSAVGGPLILNPSSAYTR